MVCCVLIRCTVSCTLHKEHGIYATHSPSRACTCNVADVCVCVWAISIYIRVYVFAYVHACVCTCVHAFTIFLQFKITTRLSQNTQAIGTCNVAVKNSSVYRKDSSQSDVRLHSHLVTQ